MRQIKLTDETYIKVRDFVLNNWQNFMNRFKYSDRMRKEKVYIGKLAEEAASSIFGGTVNYIPKEVDKKDLTTPNGTYSVKSRMVANIPKDLEKRDDYLLFFPVDQYQSCKDTCDWIVLIIIAGRFNIETDNPIVNKLDIYYYGQIRVEDFDKEKILYKTGTKISKFFTVPFPDSWGVPFTKLTNTIF